MSSVPLLYEKFLKRKESELEEIIKSKIEQLEVIRKDYFNNFGENMNICPIVRGNLNFAIATFEANLHKKHELFKINQLLDDLTASTMAIVEDHFCRLIHLGIDLMQREIASNERLESCR